MSRKFHTQSLNFAHISFKFHTNSLNLIQITLKLAVASETKRYSFEHAQRNFTQFRTHNVYIFSSYTFTTCLSIDVSEGVFATVPKYVHLCLQSCVILWWTALDLPKIHPHMCRAIEYNIHTHIHSRRSWNSLLDL